MKFVILNLISVVFTIILSLLSIFFYHPEIDIKNKILITLSLPCLICYTFYIHKTSRVRNDIRWYSGSLGIQIIIFILLVITAKMGSFRD